MFRITLAVILSAALAVLALTSCSHKAESNAAADQPQTASLVATETVSFGVDGMTCSGCEYNIAAAVKKIDGVAEVKSDYKKGVAVVKYDPKKANVDQFVEAVNKAGYKAHKSKLN